MKRPTQQNAEGPAYLQLYRHLREDIIRGVYPWGTKLPSKRWLAEERNLSTVTVAHALELLNEEGYTEPRERSGNYVIFKASDGFMSPAEGSARRFQPVRQEGKENTQMSAPLMMKAMRRVMNDYGDVMFERTPAFGRPELRKALQQYLLRSKGIVSEPEQIILGSGAEYLYGMILKLLGKERVFAIESPSYEKIEQVYRDAGVTFDSLPLTKDGVDSRALQQTEATVLHITPYRSFPTGVTATASKRHEYLNWAAKRDGFLIEDDYESEFSVLSKPEESLFSRSTKENVIYMNSFTRTISSSLRVGYMVLPRRLLPMYVERLGFYACTVPTFEQLFLTELISSGEFERHINRIRREKRRELREK